MSSKSWPTTNAVQWRVSSRKLGHHTYPVIYAVKNCSFKRRSEESLDRARKRSRTSSDPSEGCSYLCRASQTVSALAYAGLHDSTGSTSSSNEERKRSAKRKSTSDESTNGLRKKSRETPGPSDDHTQTIGGLRPYSTQDAATPVPIRCEGEEKRSGKRKSEEETQECRKRSRRSTKTPSPSEGPSHQTATPAHSTKKLDTSSLVYIPPSGSKAAFKVKYEEQMQLSQGGFGKVYQGYCKYDNMPVAIKHIPQAQARRIAMKLDTGIKMVPVEVALMLQLKPAEGATSATVTLLDWYDLDKELILVLERPVPCLDMTDYLNFTYFILPEHKAKIIVKQLVDALIEVHSKGVFHRDIKLENILIETGSDVPRVRLIDFGCGTFLTQEKYIGKLGTFDYYAPEYFERKWYMAEPTTVWQLGVVTFAMLHGHLPFSSSADIISGNLAINENLPIECQHFILSCLAKKLEARPTLESLKYHHWLI